MPTVYHFIRLNELHIGRDMWSGRQFPFNFQVLSIGVVWFEVIMNTILTSSLHTASPAKNMKRRNSHLKSLVSYHPSSAEIYRTRPFSLLTYILYSIVMLSNIDPLAHTQSNGFYSFSLIYFHIKLKRKYLLKHIVIAVKTTE